MPKRLEDSTPEELIAEIRKLRKENGSRRTSVAAYDDAFSGIDPALQRYLLSMIQLFGEDRKAGAERFLEVANSVLSPEGGGQEDEVDVMTDTDPLGLGQQSGEEKVDPTVARLLEHIQGLEKKVTELEEREKAAAQAAENRQRDEALAHLAELGYEQGTPEFDNIIELASSDMLRGDLDRAHAIYDTFYPPVEGREGDGQGQGGEGDNGQQQQDDKGQQSGGDEGQGRKHPITAGKGSVGGPLVDKSQGEDLDLSKAAVDARATEYLENLLASQQ